MFCVSVDKNIIYDGIINEFPIQLGENFNKMIEVNLNKNIKCYLLFLNLHKSLFQSLDSQDAFLCFQNLALIVL